MDTKENNGKPDSVANNDMNGAKIVYHIPATKSAAYLDNQMFASIVCMIPSGKLTTIEDIMDMWAKRKGKDYCESADGFLPYTRDFLFQPGDVQRVDSLADMLSYPNVSEDNLIPYWRLVSKRGHLIDFGYGHFWNRESQKEWLEREGHTIVKLPAGNRSYQVKDYKQSLMDLSTLVIRD